MSDVKREEFDALKQSVDKLAANSEAAPSISDQITEAMKPIQESLDAINAEREAEKEAEAANLRERIVNTGLLDEDGVKELNLNSLRKLAEKCKPGAAAPIAGHFQGNAKEEDPWKDYDLNANIDAGGDK